MPRLTKDQLLANLKEVIGENTDDKSLKLIEDVTDTYDEMEKEAKDTTDWKGKYEQNDAEWRKKYKDRFFNTSTDKEDEPDDGKDDEKEEPKPMTFDSLFESPSK